MERRENLLPYGRQWITDEDIQAVLEQLRGDWLTQGPTIAKFEAVLCELTGATYAVAVASGTAALHLAALAAGMGPGDVGLTSDNTFVASANGMRYAGARPVLVDVDPATGLMNLNALESRASELASQNTAPKLIVPVDFAGSIVDLARVRAIADRYGAKVVEDAAHSLGATYTVDGKRYLAASCAHTDMAILSFHPVKHLTTGEGGAITTNDRALYDRLCELRTHGITRDPNKLTANDGPWYYEQVELGYHYRITDLQCALGCSQARRFPGFLTRRRELAARYDHAFAATELRDKIRPLTVPTGVTSAYHLYVVTLIAREGESLIALAARRKALFLTLREYNIGPQVHYIPVHSQPDFQRNGLSEGSFEGSDHYYASCVSLPMFPRMTDDDVDYVVAVVREALA
ncbi:MAG: UDP-4-amino-4,6-dideoxy-N-acetyl-beta-L-altrosamine transaminase [Deltaproteobacteria bacterium]|nr:UDP-4-amino-4,6-dideoxy-N-acetyl-beta-L-altrosamine transaminase [Deltaproteobacteria bacterium]